MGILKVERNSLKSEKEGKKNETVGCKALYPAVRGKINGRYD